MRQVALSQVGWIGLGPWSPGAAAGVARGPCTSMYTWPWLAWSEYVRTYVSVYGLYCTVLYVGVHILASRSIICVQYMYTVVYM